MENFQRGQGQGRGQRYGNGSGRGFGRGQGKGFGQGRGFGRGGWRAGSGRPSSGLCQRVQLRLTDEQREYWMNNPELTDEIRDFIDRKMLNNQE